jgi:hypothetical protein
LIIGRPGGQGSPVVVVHTVVPGEPKESDPRKRDPMGSHAPRITRPTLAKLGFAAVAAPAALLAVAGPASAAELAPVGAYLDENVTHGTPPLERSVHTSTTPSPPPTSRSSTSSGC